METLERPLEATDEKAAMRCVLVEKSETNMMGWKRRICLMPQFWEIFLKFPWPCVDGSKFTVVVGIGTCLVQYLYQFCDSRQGRSRVPVLVEDLSLEGPRSTTYGTVPYQVPVRYRRAGRSSQSKACVRKV